jgi:transcriptional regulator with XRE-family HTH domain
MLTRMYDAAMKIARALDEAAKAAGLSDVEIAAKLGVSQVTVTRWRRGKNAPGSPELLKLFEVVPGFRKLVDSRNGAVA